MKIFKLLALMAGVTVLTMNASAQNQSQLPDPQHTAQLRTDHIKQTVTGITPDQERQIYATQLDFAKNMRNALSTTDHADKVALNNKIAPLRETRDAKMKTILTADQYKQYDLSKPEYAGGR